MREIVSLITEQPHWVFPLLLGGTLANLIFYLRLSGLVVPPPQIAAYSGGHSHLTVRERAALEIERFYKQEDSVVAFHPALHASLQRLARDPELILRRMRKPTS